MLRRKAPDGKAVCFSVYILSEALEHLRTAVYSIKNPPENLSKTFHEQSKSHSMNYFLQDDPFQTNLLEERGAAIQTEREKCTFHINIAASSWEDWNYTTPWKWNVRASFCALPQCSTFQAAQHQRVPIFTVAVLPLCLHGTAANPAFQNIVSKPVVKNPDIWSHTVTLGRAVDHRTKLDQLLHLFLSIWKTERWGDHYKETWINEFLNRDG